MSDDIVKAEDVRPAGKPGECFYCERAVGEAHQAECVILQRFVRVRVTLEIEIETVRSWDREAIEFKHNQGTWCADNFVGDLATHMKRVKESGGGCLCNGFSLEYLGEVGP